MDVEFTYEDYLIKKGEFIKQKKELLALEHQERQLSQCSFKPEIRRNSNISITRRRSPHERSKSHSRMSVGRSTEQVEFEKSKEQCTFKPNLVSSKKSFTQIKQLKPQKSVTRIPSGYSTQNKLVKVQ